MKVKIECIEAEAVSMSVRGKLINFAKELASIMKIPEPNIEIKGFHFDDSIGASHKKYTAIFETSPPPLPEREYSAEEIKKMLDNPFTGTFYTQKPEPTKHYTNVEISEETFQFINNVATIEREMYGQKTYIINNIKFWINEE